MSAEPSPQPPADPLPLRAGVAAEVLDAPEVRADLELLRTRGGTALARVQARIRLTGLGVLAEEEPAEPAPAQARPDLRVVGEPAAPAPSQGNPRPGSVPPPPVVNHAAESGVVGALVVHPDLRAELLAGLEPRHVFDPAKRAALVVVAGLHAEGRGFDGAVLVDELVRRGSLPAAAASALVANLVAAAASPELARRHAAIVRGDADRREAAEALDTFLRVTASGKGLPPTAVARARELLDRIASGDAAAWECPEPNGFPAATPFPVGSVPAPLAAFASAVANSIPCPVDFVAVMCLAVASAAVGRSVAVRVKDGYTEEVNLWVAVVGKPGTAKSPAMAAALRPIYRIQGEELHLHRLLRDRAAEARRRLKAKGKPAAEEPEDLPPPKRIVLDDVTTESMGVRIRDNPRGMLLAADELSGWLNAMNQYKGGGGSDLQFYLKLFTRTALLIDRKGQEGGIPVWVSDPFVTISGGVQPDLLKSFKSEKDDGFMDRMLFSFPRDVPVRFCRESVPPEVEAVWARAVRKLWELEPAEGDLGDLRPHVLPLAPDALDRYEAFFNASAEACEAADFPDGLRGPWAKLRTYCARISLLCEMLAWAFDPKAKARPKAVSLASVEAAAALTSYFADHFRRVLASVNGHQADNADARAVLDWLRQRTGDRTRFSVKQVKDNFRRRFGLKPEAMPEALAWLERQGYVRKLPSPPGNDPRKRYETYEVHPSAL